MKYLVTTKEMKEYDANTSKYFFVPEIVLMEQAANAFVEELCAREMQTNNEHGIRVLVCCGGGNNGADGVAIARLLNERGITADVCVVSKDMKTTKSFDLQMKIYKSYGYKVYFSDALEELSKEPQNKYDIIVDGIFGVGLSRAISGNLYNIIQQINKITSKKYAIDIPSGISATTGEVCKIAVKADVTVTFSFGKVGHYLWSGVSYCGEVIVKDIGITTKSFLDKIPKVVSLEKNDLKMLKARDSRGNKGTFGKVLVIAGHKNMAGAAILSANAAYKTGSGLVKVFTPAENRIIVQSTLPEAVLETYEVDSVDAVDAVSAQLKNSINWADAVVVGPGLGQSNTSKAIVQKVLEYINVPTVIDADALNIISNDEILKANLKKVAVPVIVTPHLGEMSRLCKKEISFIQKNILDVARKFASQYNTICVLKDAHTIISVPNKRDYINLSGNDGMATAGSGDVLTGIIASLLGQGIEAEQAAALGVYIHGLAGDVASEEGKASLMARDIISGIENIFKEIRY